jgi:hypothetical protein
VASAVGVQLPPPAPTNFPLDGYLKDRSAGSGAEHTVD